MFLVLLLLLLLLIIGLMMIIIMIVLLLLLKILSMIMMMIMLLVILLDLFLVLLMMAVLLLVLLLLCCHVRVYRKVWQHRQVASSVFTLGRVVFVHSLSEMIPYSIPAVILNIDFVPLIQGGVPRRPEGALRGHS